MVEDIPVKNANKVSGIFEPDDDLVKIKNDLEEKRQRITEMIDGLKPLEDDLARRKNIAEAMQLRIDDQAIKIESLSKELMEKNRQIQQLTLSNTDIRKQVTEKDGMNRILKDKLNEKLTLLKEVDGKNRDLEQQVDNAQKQLFSLKNKIGAVENRVFATDEQNQKLLYETVNVKQYLKSVEQELARKDSLIAAQNAEHAKNLESLKRQEEEKKILIMKNHSKKVAVFNATLGALKAKLEKQQKVIEEKARKENALMSEFGDRMKELMATRFESNIHIDEIADDLPSFENISAHEQESLDANEAFEEPIHIDDPDTVEAAGRDQINAGQDNDVSGGLNLPSKMDEIIPMVELAVDHGDDKDTIRHSLKSSGYSERDIEEAFSQLHIAEQ